MPGGRDQPSRGTIAVDPATGEVGQTTISWEKVSGTVTVTYPAPSTGIRLPVRWQSLPPASTAVVAPATVTIRPGSSEGSFQISTYYVSTAERIDVASEHWGVSQTASFTLQP